jgi:Zn-dependent protease
MQDPFSWAFPLGRFFGVPVKVNVLFPLVAAGLILRAAFQKDVVPGSWIDAAMLMALLFVVVLLHEFGHCFGARAVDGDAQEVMMWPLGGLAFVDVPHTPRANFIATVAGPAVNVIICLLSGLLFCWMTDFHVRLPLNPLPAPLGWNPYRINEAGEILLHRWDGTPLEANSLALIVTARLFWISWFTLLLNVLVPGFPLDGGRMFQCAVWWRLSPWNSGGRLCRLHCRFGVRHCGHPRQRAFGLVPGPFHLCGLPSPMGHFGGRR